MVFPGLRTTTYEQIMEDISLALVEYIVDTNIGTTAVSVSLDLSAQQDQNPLGPPWVGVQGFNCQIIGGLLEGSTDGTNGVSAYDGGISWSHDQTVSCRLITLAPGTGFAGFRLDISASHNYQAGIDTGFTPGGIGQPFSSFIVFRDGAELGRFHVGALTSGDVFTVQVVGQTITAFQNGVLLGSLVDPFPPIPAGMPGIEASPYNAGLASNIQWGGVFTAVGSGAAIFPGLNTITPLSMKGIYPGAILLVGSGASLEQIVVLSVTTTTFDAVFANLHFNSDPVFGATFPSGQTDHPLFTQAEIFGYLKDAQNDFLLKTRCIFGVTGTPSGVANIPMSTGVRFYSQPAEVIRIERIAGVTALSPAENVLMDLFNRLNENPIKLPWSSISGVAQLLNGSFCLGTILEESAAYIFPSTWGANQSSKATLVNLKQGSGYAALIVTGSPDTGNGGNYYYCGMDASPGFGGIGIFTPVHVWRIKNGVFSGLSAGFIFPNIGDEFEARITDGNNIQFFQNGILVTSAIDSDPITVPGSPGLFVQSITGTTTGVADLAWGNWSGSSELAPEVNEIDLQETTQSDLDMENSSWTSDQGAPEQWFRDQIDSGKFGLYPLPVDDASLQLWYSKRALYGAGISLFGNFLIPDVMTHYLKYGALAKCWSKDGEAHNPLRAEYCQKRFDLGVELVSRFMEGIGVQAQQKQSSTSTFSPMVLAASDPGASEVTGG
jgi:hypothetical protein